MSNTARQIIQEALRLPLDERATVVAELIANIDADAEHAGQPRSNACHEAKSGGRAGRAVCRALQATLSGMAAQATDAERAGPPPRHHHAVEGEAPIFTVRRPSRPRLRGGLSIELHTGVS